MTAAARELVGQLLDTLLELMLDAGLKGDVEAILAKYFPELDLLRTVPPLNLDRDLEESS